MPTATITSKGQVTIPKEVRERFGFKAGDELEFIEEDGLLRIRKRVSMEAIKKWEGYLKHLAGRSSDEIVEDMRGR